MTEPTRVRTSTSDALGSEAQDLVHDAVVEHGGETFSEHVEHHADATHLEEIERVALEGNEQVTTTTVNQSGGEVLTAVGAKSGRVVFSKTVLSGAVVAVILAGLALLFTKKAPPPIETPAPLAYASPQVTSVRYESLQRPVVLPGPRNRAAEAVLPVLAVVVPEPLVAAEPVVAPAGSRGTCAPIDGPAGYATIASRPYADVYIGDRRLGETPLSRHKLAPGCHELRVVTKDGRERRERIIVVSNVVSIFTVEL